MDYDSKLPLGIAVLERWLGCIGVGDEPESKIQEASDVSDEIQEISEGFIGSCDHTLPFISQVVRNFLPIIWWFPGDIWNIQQDNKGNIYEIEYEYGVIKEWWQDAYDLNAIKAGTDVGKLGFWLIKKFRGRSYFSGWVIEIQTNGKRICEYDEDEDI